MEASDRASFISRLVVLASVFDKKLSPSLQVLYFEALSDLPTASVWAALETAAKTCTFFPKPAELRAMVGGNPAERAELAWLELLREVRRVGYTGTPALPPETLETVHGLWGSWGKLCRTLPGEGPEILGWAKQFTSAYSVTSRRLSEPARIGRAEAPALLASITKRASETVQ